MINYESTSVPLLPFLGTPKWQPHFRAQQTSRRGQIRDAGKLRILVIDDEELIAETVVEILREEGFNACAVGTGELAIELARSSPPDVVLSDVIMPGMTGIELGIKIREMLPQCRVILFSGQAATVDLVDKARKEGHRFEILAKPIRPEALIEVVRKSTGPM
jgi:DNA-binding NtrC family response regulator